jgi:uncharacterized protein YrrD
MQIELGAHVRSRDDHDIGIIKHLILDPQTEEIKVVVIEKGLFLPEDREVPRSALQVINQDEARLSYTAEEVKHLPHFDESQYIDPPAETTQRFFGFPVGGLLWPTNAASIGYGPTSMAYSPGIIPGSLAIGPEDFGEPLSEEELELRRKRALENAVIAAGSDVFSREGDKVGEVDNITFDTETGHPITLVISRGFFLREELALPATVIASVDDGAVTLSISKAQLQTAPHEPRVPLI